MATRYVSQSEDEPELEYSSSSFDEGQEDISEKGVEPYRYEPNTSEQSALEEESEGIERDLDNRLTNTKWCLCALCQVMPTTEESQCCQEISKAKITGFNEVLQCITDHPGFLSVCLDPYVLETAYYQYRQQYDQHMEDSNERRRYVAYRQFVRWCWGFMGKEVRVPLPACAVNKIRQAFPSDTYTGFKWPN
ncbi:hypothetical protein ACJMK2_014152 [Sinanodonta woodiana]|uniref:P2X purinoreceptor 7 intracellular domain-containing protein n=1 Tax=Sinanodonta woodiana TaxID=1069815 RepID=A0ABD3V318_SINWO